jgi:hypothetical protein
MTLETVHKELRELSQQYGEIRFLPARRDSFIHWVDRAELAHSLAREHQAPVLTCTQVKRRANVNALPLIGTIFDQPKPSRHRSKRLWKKLRRKTARALYGQPMTLSFNPEWLKALIED